MSTAPARPRVFRDPAATSLRQRGCVVCIGAFDGLHLGHQALVRHAIERARATDVEAVALSFEPLPREFFARDNPPPRLLSPRARSEGLLALGVDRVGLLRFDAALAAMSAEDFVRRVLVGQLGVREVWVGPGFRFGKGRGGDLALLQHLGAALGFTAGAVEPATIDGERVSSTRIREALAEGDFVTANRLLGRPYTISGRVARGAQLGRTLGYPTANLSLHGRTPPFTGIHAARVHGVGPQPWPAVTSLGTRPTVNGTEPLLEAHLFDFDADLYGCRIAVEFVAKLRDEEKFDDLPTLVAQMRRDAERARAILDHPSSRATA